MCEKNSSSRGVWEATVVSNEPLCREHFRLRLRQKAFPATQPGQFVQLLCRSSAPPADVVARDWPAGRPPRLTQPELSGPLPLLRRPLSLAGRRDAADGTELEILYRLVGAGTAWLAGVQPGAVLSVLGPLGQPFPILPDRPRAVLVGGGVGIPPLLYLAEALRQANKSAVAFCGARAQSLLPLTPGPQPADADGCPTLCTAEFARQGVPTVLTTDDGSRGAPGQVTEALDRWLTKENPPPASLTVYACGPEVMMRRVAEICQARRLTCYLSLERHMACGMGTCQSCVVKIRDASPRGWSYRLCCTDGPVFRAEDVIWT